MFVNGSFVDPYSTGRIDVINPATEKSIGTIVDGDDRDVDRAVRAAHEAFLHSGWRELRPSERAQYIRALADALEQRSEEMATLVASENGMPITIARAGHGPRLTAYYRYFADLADALETETAVATANGHALVRRQPLGVVAAITAWNGPQGLVAWKLGPALAAGCTVVIKPAPETSLDARLLAEAVLQAGIPDGVVNIVTGGRETGAALVTHPLVAKIAFTGSSAAGRVIAQSAGAGLKHVSLELGGKSAAILLDDFDLGAFAPFVTSACSPLTGQTCRALTRILAPRSRYDDVVSLVADTMSGVRTGDPMDPATVFGPLVAERQRDRVEGYIRLGVEEGAKIVIGGGRPRELPVGYYIEPTVFTNVDNGMRLAREEIFGPVLVVMPYSGEQEAIRIANDSEYGLGGGVFTADTARGTDIARQVETGSIGINSFSMPMEAPFGGVKASGLGRELGAGSVLAYTETKTIFGDVYTG
jgi:aldehyde dehydrogenase (NAD+)